MTPNAGEIWLVDGGTETRRLVYVVSSSRFHRLSDRAVIAPVLERMPAVPPPWYIPAGDRAIAVHQLGTTTIDRLLEPIERPDAHTLRQVRRAIVEITS